MKLRLVDAPRYQPDGFVPGDCWYAVPVTTDTTLGPTWAMFADGNCVLTEYDIATSHQHRRPMIVVLPNGVPFSLMGSTIKDGQPSGRGWSVEGVLPMVTVAPSIHFDPGGRYDWHGYIVAGEFR